MILRSPRDILAPQKNFGAFPGGLRAFWKDFGPFRWVLGLLPLTAVVAHGGGFAPDTPGSAAQLRGPSQHEAVVAREAEDAAGGVRGEARLHGAVRERERRGATERCGG